jgi:hypothetical protein
MELPRGTSCYHPVGYPWAQAGATSANTSSVQQGSAYHLPLAPPTPLPVGTSTAVLALVLAPAPPPCQLTVGRPRTRDHPVGGLPSPRAGGDQCPRRAAAGAGGGSTCSALGGAAAAAAGDRLKGQLVRGGREGTAADNPAAAIEPTLLLLALAQLWPLSEHGRQQLQVTG